MRILNVALIVFAFLISWPLKAGPRAERWSGVDVGFGSAPFPSVVGLMAGFNIEDDARISAGAGLFGKWTTYQVDAKFFLAPTDWAFYFGGGLSFLSGNRGSFFIWNYDFNNAVVPYIEFGLDFQAPLGIHAMFNIAGSAPSGEITVLPGIAIGWYF